MKLVPAIVESAIDQHVSAVRAVMAEIAEAVRQEAKAAEHLVSAREITARLRLALGRELLAVRPMWPARGPKAKGWGDFLAKVGIDQDVALDAMRYAGYVEEQFPAGVDGVPGNLPSLREAGIDRRPHESDTTSGGGVVEWHRDDTTGEPAPKANRDGWCTPAPIAEALPKELDLDPCSNPRSIVQATTKYMLETGQNGLLLPWFGLVFVNGPYSDLLPFAEKLESDRKAITGAGFLVNADNSPAWWHVLKKHLDLRLDFDARQEFIPPPGVDPSKNDRPQTLLMDQAFWAACDQRALLTMGTLWQQLKTTGD